MPSIGQTLAGRYRLDAWIGSGGFATVFRAHDLRLERDVALKVLLTNQATDPVVADRFDREARVLAAIDHPNVVAIHDVEPADPAMGAEPFLVMDLCNGGSLADRLAGSASGALPPDELVPILVDVAAGLDALHAQGIVHRDLKPSNVLLADGRARIADLGVAADGPSELTTAGTMVGTLAYLAPEQLAGEPATASSDVHALGVIAFLGLTGRLPRPAGSVAELVAASTRSIGPVSVLAPRLGPTFDVAIADALAVDPSERPTAAEFGSVLVVALERWRSVPAQAGADDVTTLTDVPIPGDTSDAALTALAAPAAGAALAADIPSARGRDRRILAAAGLAIAVLVLGSALFASLGSFGSADRGSPSDTGRSSGSTPSVTSGTSSSPTTSPLPSATTPATIDPYGTAHAASVDLRAALAASHGKGGLSGREGKDLESALDRFDRAITERDPTTARAEANKIAKQLAALIGQGAVDASTARALRTATDRLVTAAEALG